MARRRVLLPEPDGPSTARNSPGSTCSETRSRAAKRPNCLEMSWTDSPAAAVVLSASAALARGAGFEPRARGEGDKAEPCQKRRDGECGCNIVVIIKHFHV